MLVSTALAARMRPLKRVRDLACPCVAMSRRSCAAASPMEGRITRLKSLSARAARDAESSSKLPPPPGGRPASASSTTSRAPGNQSHHASTSRRETRSNFGRTGPSSRPCRVTRAIASVERTSKHDSIASGPSWRAHGSTALDATSLSSSRRSRGSPAAAGSAGCVAETSMDMGGGVGGASSPSSSADGPIGGRQASPSGDGRRSASAKTAALSSKSKAAAAASLSALASASSSALTGVKPYAKTAAGAQPPSAAPPGAKGAAPRGAAAAAGSATPAG
mmetsp:Transcript_45008/g.142907  ORF Transcript_45008/g.142907 Transcript_45008/m.142907 type:complete len:278 (+) Transcript_45008:1291-2124(+)